ncbi:MAG TPA: MCE family protein [Acidimicrobiales bacterium]|nr:MCE family protein [Acidimicrobiales bacterium]
MRSRRWAMVPLLLVTATGFSGCLGFGSSPQRTVTAVFSDVEDLTSGAQVQLADVPIGNVTSITLVGNQAKVTMSLSESARIPADVTAAIDHTTLLGDLFIQLEVPPNEVRASATQVPQLANGAVIRHTRIVPSIEQLVKSGAQVFGAVSTTELEQIIAAGGEGFAGQEASLKALLTDFTTVANGYAQHTADITSAVNGLNQLTASLAPNSGANADALTTLSKTVAILARNSTQFETLLQSINNLSVQGRSILETYEPQMVAQLQTLQAISAQLSQNQVSLVGILNVLPLTNAALPSSVRNGYVQVFENLIVCGLTGGGENDNTAAFTCARKP